MSCFMPGGTVKTVPYDVWRHMAIIPSLACLRWGGGSAPAVSAADIVKRRDGNGESGAPALRLPST